VRNLGRSGTRCLRRVLAASLVLASTVPGAWASHASAGQVVVCDDPFVKLNIQAETLTASASFHFEGADPGPWTMEVIRPAGFGSGGVDIPYPESVLAQGSGAGHVSGALLDVPDPEWRWKLLVTADTPVRISWTLPGGVEIGCDQDTYLRVMANAGRSDGGSPMLAVPGMVPIYTGPGNLAGTLDPSYPALGRLVHAAVPASKILRRGAMRSKVKVPFLVHPVGSSSVQAVINYVPRRNPRAPVEVYSGRIAIGQLAPGTRVSVATRLTRAGQLLAKRLGAARLARALRSTGRVDFTGKTRSPGGGVEVVWVPVGTSFPNDQLDRGWPSAQTCPAFPGMPTGFAVYSAIGLVYGSYTCRRGDPLVPSPMV